MKFQIYLQKKWGTSKEVSEVGDHKFSSDSVLQNIQRVEDQKNFEIDSDDEISEQNDNKEIGVPMIMPSCMKEVRESNTTTTLESTSKSHTSVGLQKRSETNKSVTPFHLIRQILNEWKTEATVEYLRNKYQKGLGTSFEDKYEALGKIVDARQIDDELDDTSDDGLEV